VPVLLSSSMISVPGDVARHEVRRELDAGLKLRSIALRDGPHHERLGQPRHADHQAVAAREQGRQQVIDDVFLADDHFRDLFLELLAGGAEALDRFEVAGREAAGPAIRGLRGRGSPTSVGISGVGTTNNTNQTNKNESSRRATDPSDSVLCLLSSVLIRSNSFYSCYSWSVLHRIRDDV